MSFVQSVPCQETNNTHTQTIVFRKHWRILKWRDILHLSPVSLRKTGPPPDIFPGPECTAAGSNLFSAFSSSWMYQVLSARALWRIGYHCSASGKWCSRNNKRGPGLKYIKGSQDYTLTALSDLLIQRHTSYLPRGEANLPESADSASQIRLPTARQAWWVRTQWGAPSLPAMQSQMGQGGNSGRLCWATA